MAKQKRGVLLKVRVTPEERERSRKYSVSWQQKHSAAELQKISRAIVYLQAKGVATDKGEINRMIRKTNRIIREIRGYIDELREWLAEVFRTKKELQAAPRSPDIATLLTKYLSVERERSRKYSVSWQQKHSASELQKISRAIVYLQAKGVAMLSAFISARRARTRWKIR